MASIMQLPQEVLNELKCFYCENCLSVPPITIISNEGDSFKCGRCQNIASDVNIRSTCYETMARYFLYPCMYGKCEERLTWGNVKRHEQNCPHKTIHCPIFWACPESPELEITEILNHFQEQHPQLIFHDIARFKMVSMSTVILLKTEEQLFFIYMLGCPTGGSRVSVCVYSLGDSIDGAKYQIKLSPDDKSESLLLYDNLEVLPYNDMHHCLGCVRGKCQLKIHKYSEKTGSVHFNAMKIRLDLLSLLFPSKNMRCTIKVSMNKTGTSGETSGFDKVEDVLRTNLECPMCQEYMKPPIYTCETGHVICNDCKEMVERCPTCRKDLTDCRNFVLEEVSATMAVPCIYKSQGCPFTSKITFIADHETSCQYKDEHQISPKRPRITQ